jgi:hypothetical protein
LPSFLLLFRVLRFVVVVVVVAFLELEGSVGGTGFSACEAVFSFDGFFLPCVSVHPVEADAEFGIGVGFGFGVGDLVLRAGAFNADSVWTKE